MSKPDTTYSGPELCTLSARETVAKLKIGEISPRDCLDAAFTRIGQVESAINATPTLCQERAFKALDNLEADAKRNGTYDGWLAGLPITIKDLNEVKGVRTTFGCPGHADFIPQTSDPLVDILEGHGGVVIGKTNTPQYGAGANTFNDVFGPTRNPWDTRMNPAGSSGGAAAALATGECWLAHGSDYGGSLRTPAAYCGIVGMRPSPGRCGGAGPKTAFIGEGVSGPMARDVEDLALCLDAMAGYNTRAPLSIEKPAISFQEDLKSASQKIRIAFSPDQGGFSPVEQEIRDVMAEAMAKVERAGGTVEEACPDLPKLNQTFRSLRAAAFTTSVSLMEDHVKPHLKATIVQNAKEGSSLTASEILSANVDRSVLYNNMRIFLQTYDVLAIPVAGIAPQLSEIEYPTHVAGQKMIDYIDWLSFAFLATTTTLPAISVPIGFTPSGLPCGIQLIGPPRGEAKLLKVAKAVENAVGFAKTPIDPIVRH